MEILKKITELKSELDGLRPLSKDREAAIMQKLRLDWNYHSNHLEGNSLTFGETKALILFGITAAGKPLKDHFEMTGHDQAVKWVEDVVKEGRPLTETFIRELHLLILKEPYESPTITPEGIPAKRIIRVGVYKSVPNHVLTPTGEIFRFATPEETPAMMHDLISWYRQKENDPDSHPLLLAAEFHYKFIRIHPFDDGNGRTARILMNFILMKYGYPPVIIKTEDKSNYIAALQQSDAGMISPFIEYIGQNLAHSLEIMVRGAKGENIDEPDDVDKEIALIEKKLKIFGREVKSLSNVKIIFDSSLKRLLTDFAKSNLKFSRFYKEVQTVYEAFGDRQWSNTDYSKIVNTIEEKLERHSQNFEGKIELLFHFTTFNRDGYEHFDFDSAIEIHFLTHNYTIRNLNSRFTINKTYLEQLSADEIDIIVRDSEKHHLKIIEHYLEKSQQKAE